MPRIKLISTNKEASIVITLLIILFSVTTILIPLVLIYIIPRSGIGNYIFQHLYLGYIFLPFILYFLYTGIYFYQIKIDSYIIDIRSNRTIAGVFQSPNCIDIAHSMLAEFAFFDRSYSFNKTLMVKIKTSSGKKVVKRFNLTLMSKKEEEKISKVLEKIIARNS